MTLLYGVALRIHVVAGAVALLVFWIPLVAKKGGRLHRRIGWVYVGAAATIAVTGVVVCGRLITDPNPLRHRAGIFLLYVGVLAAASALFGVRALRTKRRDGASRALADLVPPVLLVLGGVGLAAFGIEQAMPLYLLFAALGLVQGVARLRFWLTPPVTTNGWFIAHMSGMGTSCITTVTAFSVVNAHRLGMRTFDLVVWVVPALAGGIALGLATRKYRRRFAEKASDSVRGAVGLAGGRRELDARGVPGDRERAIAQQ
jgi:uncharacterized membrane protein